jgi:hypothetical protein
MLSPCGETRKCFANGMSHGNASRTLADKLRQSFMVTSENAKFDPSDELRLTGRPRLAHYNMDMALRAQAQECEKCKCL